ncbi:hypothetical protein ABH999_005610 [Bradyrhizobium yuanmingense]
MDPVPATRVLPALASTSLKTKKPASLRAFQGFTFLVPGRANQPDHSHSIVPGGLLVTSYTTRFTPFTSLMIRVAVSPKNFMSNW